MFPTLDLGAPLATPPTKSVVAVITVGTLFVNALVV